MSHAMKFCRNPDAVYHQSLRYKIYQSNQIELLPHQIFSQLLLMVNVLEQY